MAEEITLSVMRNSPQTEPVLRQLLDEFEGQTRIRVRLEIMDWTTAHHQAKQFAIYQQGPDVSELGTTWVAEMAAMNALRAFSAAELARIGQLSDFISASWEATRLPDDENKWTVPWLVDTYVVHYRRDVLESLGIDANTAFSNLEKIDETIGRLSVESNFTTPVQLPFSYDLFCTMHTLAAWIWNYGGEFTTPDGTQVLFDRPEALEGIINYFRLARHLSQPARERLALPNSEGLFRYGKAAVAFGTLSFKHRPEEFNPQVHENWAALPIPGPHFVGGVNLIVWKYSKHESAAVELVRFLNRPEVVTQCARAMRSLPAYIPALKEFEAQDPFLKAMTDSAQTGRAYYPVRLWGIIEERFMQALGTISNELLRTSDVNLDEKVRQTILPLARRLNVTLGT